MATWPFEIELELKGEEEPSVLSTNPNERKLARRLRIQRRLETLTKQAQAADEAIVDKTPIEVQILSSFTALEKCENEGKEVVSSVKIANDARELQRRSAERDVKLKLLKKLEDDDRECTQKYEEINMKWPEILASRDPLNIHEGLVSQNEKCLEILAKKDVIIAELRKELEHADEIFLEDLDKQNEDINVLAERIDGQARIISKAYRDELNQIENVIDSERKLLLENVSSKWEALYKKILENDREGVEKRKEIMLTYEEDMKQAILEHQEEFRSQKIQLEVECQKMQQEVQNMKALCLMNVEKLDYNYAVLKRREEENTIIKNEQKRRINKLQDVLSSLRKNYKELEKKTRAEIQRLTDQVLKAHKNILELEEKSDRFANINERKYLQIWDMNVKAANELVDKILTADKVIHEQALGLEWYPPEQSLLTIKDLPSYCTALAAMEEKKQEYEKRKKVFEVYKPANTLEEINLERRMLNHILKHISDRSGYLIEDDLRELLLPYTRNDNVIIRLDNVFQAIHITCEKEVQYLLNFFLPYAYCPTCETIDTSKATSSPIETPSSTPEIISDVCDDHELKENSLKLISIINEEIQAAMQCGDTGRLVSSVGSTTFESSHEFENPSSQEEESTNENYSNEHSSNENSVHDNTYQEDFSDDVVEDNLPNDTDIKDVAVKDLSLVCEKGHLLEIRTVHVTRALREFIEKYHFLKSTDVPLPFHEKLLLTKLTISRSLTTEDVTKFWEQYEEIFPSEKERLWDGLLTGLKKYYDVLKERHELNIETENLRRQNAELRRLLKTCTDQIDSNLLEEFRSITDMS